MRSNLLSPEEMEAAECETQLRVSSNSGINIQLSNADSSQAQRQPSTFETNFGRNLHKETEGLEEIWERILPLEFKPLRNLLILRPTRMWWYYRISCATSTFLMTYIFAVFVNHLIKGAGREYAPYGVSYIIQSLLYVMMPFWCMSLLRDVLRSDDIPVLFTEAARFDKYFLLKFRVLTHFNFVLIIMASIVYVIFIHDGVYLAVPQMLLTMLYFFPFMYACTITVILLEAYRLQSQRFVFGLHMMRLSQIRRDQGVSAAGVGSTATDLLSLIHI